MAMSRLLVNRPPSDVGSHWGHWARRLVAGLAASCALAGVAYADCKGLVLHAHRGTSDQPENSLSAIKQALKGSWDGVEIDLQQLRDRQWVIHHDPVLGRTTSLARRNLADLDSTVWREVRLKDRQGRVTSEPAPFLADTLQSLTPFEGKVVNAEIKQGFKNCEASQQAVAAMNQGRPSGQWFLTSVERRHLQCARQADPQGYLGVIVLDPQGLALSDPRTARTASRLSAPVIDSAWLRRLQQEVAPPVGVHVDINTLHANPGLLADARLLNLPVFTYHLGADRDHAQALRQTAQRSGLWPSGAIIDGQPEPFCDQLTRR